MHDADVLDFLRVQHATPAWQLLRPTVCKLFAAQAIKDSMQVAKPSYVKATHYAMAGGLLGGALVVAAQAGQDRRYSIPSLSQSCLQ